MRIEEFRLRFQGNGGRALVVVLSALLLMPADSLLFAQDAAAPAPAGDEQEAPKLTNDQLDGLVAPVALYPDPLLAQVLVASTYPLDIVQAQQWLTQNSSLKGDELTKAAEKQQWDASVQAMVLFPDVVKRFSENIKWTTDLGNAFLAQQEDVMDAVQRLRAAAKDAGKLESSEQQKVETKTVESKTVIEIQPASTQVVYVPTYNPTVIWGSAYAYPPMYYPPYYPGAGLISFGVGMAVGAAISGGWGWGCGWGGGNTVNINNNNNFVRNSNVNNNINRSGNSNWQHNAKGRGGVPYGDRATANKYGGGARGDSMASRQQQARTRQGSAGGAGDRSAGGAGNRGGGSGGMSNRGGGGGMSDRSGGGASSRSGGGGASSFSGGQGGNRSSQVGSRNVSPSSRSSNSGAFGGSQSGSKARASSSRGSSSMSSSRGGGGRGGGGGGRRR